MAHRLLAFTLTALLFAIACAPDPGKIRLVVDWGAYKPTDPVYLWLRVEERPALNTSGITLSSAGPLLLGPLDSFDVPLDVPHGKDRVVIIEVRDSSSSSQPIVLYGISDKFSFHAGDDLTVEVPIKITQSESITFAPELELVGAEQVVLATYPSSSGVPQPVPLEQLRNVDFRSRTVGAAGIVLSRASSFSGATVYDLGSRDSQINCEPIPGDEGMQDCEVTELDLAEGIENPPDGQYTLFVKLLDRYGYESPVYELTVALDSTAPLPALATLSPTSVKAGDSALLTVTFGEELLNFPENPGLIADPNEGITFAAGERIGESNTFRWVLTATAGSETPKPYTFKVQARDLVGNQTEYVDVSDKDDNLLALTVDAVAPRISEPESITYHQLFGPDALADGKGTLSFAFVIIEDNPADLGGTDCPGCPEVRFGGSLLGTVSPSPEYDGSSGSHEFTYSYEVSAAHWSGQETQSELSIRWADAAGNIMEEALPEPVRFDFRAPVVQCFPSHTMAKLGDLVQVQVQVNEPLQGNAPQLPPELIGLWDLSEPPPNATLFTFTRPVEAQDEVVSWDFESSPVDIAGNPASKTCALAVGIDSKPPTLSSFELYTIPEVYDSDASLWLATGGNQKVVAEFSVTETQGLASQSPVVALAVAGIQLPFAPMPGAGEDFIDACAGPEGGIYTCTTVLDIPPEDLLAVEGSWPVSVTLEDVAGNVIAIAKANQSLVTIDATPPSAQCTVIPDLDGSPAPLGQPVLLQVSPFEELLQPGPEDNFEAGPELLVTNDGEEVADFFAPVADTSYRFTHTVEEGDGEADYLAIVTLTDRVGNVASGADVCGGEVVIAVDGVKPSAELVHLTLLDGTPVAVGTPLAAGAIILAAVGTQGSILPPTVSIGGGTMETEQGILGEVMSADGELVPGWLLKRNLDGTELQGDVFLTIHLSDSAGNSFPGSSTVVATFDFTAPQVASSSLVITPPANSKVKSVTKITAGTSLKLSLTASEPLAGLPFVVASKGDYQLVFGQHQDEDAESGKTTYLFQAHPNSNFIPDTDEAQGQWTLTAEFADVAGNQQNTELSPYPAFIVDSQPPATMGIEYQPGLRLYRNPWGSKETGYVPKLAVQGCGELNFPLTYDFCPEGFGGFPESESHIVIYKPAFLDGAIGCAESVVTVTDSPVGPTTYEIPLWFDLPAVCISQVDEAGNESKPFLIDTVEWVATLNGKVAGDTTVNPHTLYEHDVHGKHGLVRLATEGFEVLDQARLSGVGQADDGKVAENQLHPGWRHRRWNGTDYPYVDSGTGEILTWIDPYRGRVQTVHPSNYNLLTVYEWDGFNYHETPSQAFPPPLTHFGMAYDWDRDEAVLFGGLHEEQGVKQDTWRYDGANWIKVTTDDWPSARMAMAMGYDPVHRQMLLYGGSSTMDVGEANLNDTWLWSVDTWVKLSPATLPPALTMPHLRYDPEGNRLLLFGVDSQWGDPGPVAVYQWTGDDWVEAGSSGEEVEMDPGSGSNGDTWSIAYEPAEERFLAISADQDLLYSWTDGVWQEEEWDSGEYELDSTRSLVYDPFENAMTLFRSPDVMFWKDGPWCNLADWDRGPADVHHGSYAAYYPERSTVVCATPTEVWEWDGDCLRKNWSSIYPSPTGGESNLAYDGNLGVLHYIALHGNELLGFIQWLWDGDEWSEHPDLETEPAAEVHFQNSQTFSWDGVRGHNLYVREQVTWVWDGVQWQRFEGLADNPVSPNSATHDPDTGATIVTDNGGSYATNYEGAGTHLFDGLTWTYVENDLEGEDKRQVAEYGVAAFDRARGIALHLGNEGNGQHTVREFDGELWNKIEPSIPFPVGEKRPVMAFHEPTMSLVVVGGQELDSGLTNYSAGAHLYSPANARPHLIAAFDLVAGQALPADRLFEAAAIDSIGVTVQAGATSHTAGSGRRDGELVEGFEVKGFLRTPDPWYSLSAVDGATPEAMALWSREIGPQFYCEGQTYCKAATLDRWVAPDGKLYLDIAPIEAWGATPEKPVIALDYVELRLVYSTGKQCEPGTECCTDLGRFDEGAFCTDDDPCTTGSACHRGQCGRPVGTTCQSGETRCHLGELQTCTEIFPDPVDDGCWVFATSDDCDDGNPCTADSCVELTGCQHGQPAHQCELETTTCLVNRIRTCVDLIEGDEECRQWGEAEDCPAYSTCQGEVGSATCQCVDTSCQGTCCPYDSLLGIYECDGGDCVLPP
jgi:hypothetical protein